MKEVTVARLEMFRIRVTPATTYLFLRLWATDDTSGLGEASMSGNDLQTVQVAAALFESICRARPVAAIDTVTNALQETAGASPDISTATAVSAVEQALWDLRAKQVGVPIYALLGGAHRKQIPLYANINRGTHDRTAAGFAAATRSAVVAGFSAVKCMPFDGIYADEGSNGDAAAVRRGISRVRAVRDAADVAYDVMVDCHGRFDLVTATKVAHELEPFGLRWYEEPIATHDQLRTVTDPQRRKIPGAPQADPLDLDALRSIAAATSLPLAGGEFPFGVEQFTRLLEPRALSVIMPDVKHCGGIREAYRIAELAARHQVAVSPHNPSGPVATMASAHLCATLSAPAVLEYQWNEFAERQDLTTPAEPVTHGQLTLSDEPGLGITLNEEMVARFAVGLDD